MLYALYEDMEVKTMNAHIKVIDQDPALIAQVLAAGGGPPKRAVSPGVKRPRPDHDVIFRDYNPESTDPVEQTICIPREDVPPISGE